MEITREHRKAAAQWLAKNHPDLTKAAIGRIVGTTDRTAARLLEEFVDANLAKNLKRFFDTKEMKFFEVEQIATNEKTAKYQFVMTNKTITVIRNGKPMIADKDHRHYEEIKAACVAKEYAKAYDLMNDKAGVLSFADGLVEIYNGVTIFKGSQISGEIGKKIVTMAQEGRTNVAEAFSNFLVRVFKNPDDNMPERLFAFCMFNDIKIEKDGMVLAYKVVGKDYLDLYTSTMSNAPGKTVEVRRDQVNPNPDVTCSYGLHVCSIDYLKSYGMNSSGSVNKVVLCRVDPADFVAVPRDYGNRKARVMKYQVLADVTNRARKILGYDDLTGNERNAVGLKMDREAVAQGR